MGTATVFILNLYFLVRAAILIARPWRQKA
jgi:hypothetical protein